ncbi:MAG: hypothetical protein AAF623_01830 [Planctomycetota bacterium]
MGGKLTESLGRNPWLRSLMFCLISLSLISVTGCNGCRKKDDQEAKKKKEEEEKKKKKPKPDFESNSPVLLPGVFPEAKKSIKELEEERKRDPQAGFNDPVMRINRAKPGHWYTASVQAIANNFNSESELTAFSMDGVSRPIRIPSTDYYLTSTRPVSMPKGEWKNFETSVFVPKRDKISPSINVNYTIHRSNSGSNQLMFPQPTISMTEFQHHVLLLSTRPDSYNFLKLTDNFQLTGQTGAGTVIPPFYYLVATEPGDPSPMPQHVLNWTTIAYLIWDDLDPTTIDSDRQQAIIDWIHFGGQLIVSGPDSLDKLQNSFLADYLPAQFESSRGLTNQDIEELNKNWAVPGRYDKTKSRKLVLSDKVPLLGVNFKPHTSAQFVDGTGELAIERQLGRGRIVVTAFSLNNPTIRAWRSLKSFINGALLRKPARNFGKLYNQDVGFEWVGNGTPCFDPMMNTTLRFLSRDLSNKDIGTPSMPENIRIDQEDPGFRMGNYDVGDELDLIQSYSVNPTKTQGFRNLEDTRYFGGFQDASQAGLGGWNDHSGISVAARNSLTEAAGITPPSSAFVLKMLAVYLIVLVPVNWFLFWMIGKVEYAWVAAPIISVVGAFFVIRMASLDIGFVRSNTQVGLVEAYGDYSRGHLSEYSALYTSLSTGYNVDLENSSAQTLPFASTGKNEAFKSKESQSEVNFRRGAQNRIRGFQIQSNSTGLLHSENMLDLGGVFSFTDAEEGEQPYLSNSTGIAVEHVGILKRTLQGDYQLAWVDQLPNGEGTELQFENVAKENLGERWYGIPGFGNTMRDARALWRRNFGKSVSVEYSELESLPELKENWQLYQQYFFSVMSRKTGNEASLISSYEFATIFRRLNNLSDINVGGMLDKVIGNLTLGKGEVRLVGVTTQRLGATRYDPSSTQTNRMSLVVVHLTLPKLPKASADLNTAEDFRVVSDLDREKEMEIFDDEFQDAP